MEMLQVIYLPRNRHTINTRSSTMSLQWLLLNIFVKLLSATPVKSRGVSYLVLYSRLPLNLNLKIYSKCVFFIFSYLVYLYIIKFSHLSYRCTIFWSKLNKCLQFLCHLSIIMLIIFYAIFMYVLYIIDREIDRFFSQIKSA